MRQSPKKTCAALQSKKRKEETLTQNTWPAQTHLNQHTIGAATNVPTHKYPRTGPPAVHISYHLRHCPCFPNCASRRWAGAYASALGERAEPDPHAPAHNSVGPTHCATTARKQEAEAPGPQGRCPERQLATITTFLVAAGKLPLKLFKLELDIHPCAAQLH